jgi:hypothetical protein
MSTQVQQIQTNTQNIKYIEPKVFNFRRHWSKKVKPHLFDEKVQYALNIGMEELMDIWRFDAKIKTEEEFEALDEYMKQRFTWTPGNPPYLKTSSDYWLNFRTPKKHSVDWYRPMQCCHWICFFCFELGRKIYPKLDWEILQGKRHSVAVGFKYNQPYMIFDILNFEQMSAQNILDFADKSMTKKVYEKKWRKENRYGRGKG